MSHLLKCAASITAFYFFTPFLSFSQIRSIYNNGDFENYKSYHTSFGQIDYANGIEVSSCSPDYFNNNRLNTNTYRTINPFSGNGCIGISASPVNLKSYNYRNALIILDTPTVNGKQYAIDFYLFCDGDSLLSNIPDSDSCLSFGFYFFKSNNSPLTNDSCRIPDTLINDYQIIQKGWHSYNLLYTASDVCDRVEFGWFLNQNAIEKITNQSSINCKYVFIDKLSIKQLEDNTSKFK